MKTGKVSIRDTKQRESFRQEKKIQPFRMKQIINEVFNQHTICFEDMTILPLSLRESLDKNFSITSLQINKIIEDEETTKFLFETSDKKIVETVVMYHFHNDEKTEEKKLNRMTLCISSQVGCNVGCIFCVTGKMGLQKNLKRDEILSQVLIANNYVKKKRGKKEDGTRHSIRNVVFMGMGEPLLNYPAVKTVCGYLTDTQFYGLSRKRVTVSTSGVIQPLQQFVQDNLPVSLAFSLHSPDQKLREELVPTIARFYTLDKLFEIFDKYTAKTGNKIFYEYVMLHKVNDTTQLAHKTGKLLQNRPAHLNLIPYNENPAIEMQESTPQAIKKFKDIVESYGVPVTIRQNMGRKAKSACGQLGYEKIQSNIQQ